MSICLNNDLIWISIPRCASMSIEKSIVDSNIEYHHISDLDSNYKKIEDIHVHLNVDKLKRNFGCLETVCIRRDWFDRWISSLEYIWITILRNKLTPKCRFIDIDNDFIYQTFTKSFVNKLYHFDDDEEVNKELYSILINEDINEINEKIDISYTGLFTLKSQNLWTNNEKCTYEFDIKEMYKFEKFISNRYNVDFKIVHVNKSKKLQNKIIVNDELKNFIWNRFEEPYIRKNKLI